VYFDTAKENGARIIAQKLEKYYSLEILLKRDLIVRLDAQSLNPTEKQKIKQYRQGYTIYFYDESTRQLREDIKDYIGKKVLAQESSLENQEERWINYVTKNFDQLIGVIEGMLDTGKYPNPVIRYMIKNDPGAIRQIARDQLVATIGEHVDIGVVYLYYHAPELRNIHIHDLEALAYGSRDEDMYAIVVPTAASVDLFIQRAQQFVTRRGRGIASEWSTRIPARSVSNIHGYRIALRRVTPSTTSVYVSVRFHRAAAVSIDGLIDSGMLSREQALLLTNAVEREEPIIVAGAPGAGKTTLMRVLTRSMPRWAKLVVLENEEELHLHEFVLDEYNEPWHYDLTGHVERQGTADGAQPITAQQLLANALHKDKNRIIMGDTRDGPTMLQLLKAASTGMRGVMTTLHASSVEDVLTRVHALLAETDYPPQAHNMLIQQALQWIVHIAAFPQPDGTVRHRVTGIGIVERGEGAPEISMLWKYDPQADTWTATPRAQRVLAERNLVASTSNQVNGVGTDCTPGAGV
jgi:Flp pilus assembly CpaF family ATPase